MISMQASQKQVGWKVMRSLRNVGLEGCVRCLNVLILTWGDSIRRHLPHALHTWSHRSRDSVRSQQPALYPPARLMETGRRYQTTIRFLPDAPKVTTERGTCVDCNRDTVLIRVRGGPIMCQMCWEKSKKGSCPERSLALWHCNARSLQEEGHVVRLGDRAAYVYAKSEGPNGLRVYWGGRGDGDPGDEGRGGGGPGPRPQVSLAPGGRMGRGGGGREGRGCGGGVGGHGACLAVFDPSGETRNCGPAVAGLEAHDHTSMMNRS